MPDCVCLSKLTKERGTPVGVRPRAGGGRPQTLIIEEHRWRRRVFHQPTKIIRHSLLVKKMIVCVTLTMTTFANQRLQFRLTCKILACSHESRPLIVTHNLVCVWVNASIAITVWHNRSTSCFNCWINLSCDLVWLAASNTLVLGDRTMAVIITIRVGKPMRRIMTSRELSSNMDRTTGVIADVLLFSW